MDIENFFQDTLETRIERLEKKNKENESNILRIFEHLNMNDKGTIDKGTIDKGTIDKGTINQIKNIKEEKDLEKRINYLEKRDIIIEKALLGIIERL